MKTVEQMLGEISKISEDVLVETNSGTFGAEECAAKVGAGDPAFGEYRIFERLDGTRYTVGCDPKKAPGYARHFSPSNAAARRENIAALKLGIKSVRSADERLAQRKIDLARGWDGFRFIGTDEGKKLLESI